MRTPKTHKIPKLVLLDTNPGNLVPDSRFEWQGQGPVVPTGDGGQLSFVSVGAGTRALVISTYAKHKQTCIDRDQLISTWSDLTKKHIHKRGVKHVTKNKTFAEYWRSLYVGFDPDERIQWANRDRMAEWFKLLVKGEKRADYLKTPAWQLFKMALAPSMRVAEERHFNLSHVAFARRCQKFLSVPKDRATITMDQIISMCNAHPESLAHVVVVGTLDKKYYDALRIPVYQALLYRDAAPLRKAVSLTLDGPTKARYFKAVQEITELGWRRLTEMGFAEAVRDGFNAFGKTQEARVI